MEENALNRLRDLAISESGFIFDPYSGATFNTNETGRFIFKLLKEGIGIDEIQSEMKKNFDIGEEDLRTDIYEFINLLKENHLLPKHFTF
ncbi:MAG: PqqD family protein [Thermodesulfobacteriota bacterium]|nr:PqqD family protein [Thermodesulfobacteriota bacterium]